jgi:phosphohistidine phosphatase
MMKRLFLLRHAKAVAADAHTEDSARVLAERGRSDALRMGEYLRKTHGAPDLVLCSTASRTVETWELASRAFEAPPKVQFMEALYLAPWSAILKLARAAPDSAASLLIIGHNPGMENLADILAREPKGSSEKKRANSLEEKFPTAALAVFHFDAQKWKNIAAGEGVLADFRRPKDV